MRGGILKQKQSSVVGFYFRTDLLTVHDGHTNCSMRFVRCVLYFTKAVMKLQSRTHLLSEVLRENLVNEMVFHSTERRSIHRMISRHFKKNGDLYNLFEGNYPGARSK